MPHVLLGETRFQFVTSVHCPVSWALSVSGLENVTSEIYGLMALAKFIAQQLGNPSGITGNLVGLLWNRRNIALNDVAFDNLALNPHDRVLDVGFGGGYLLGRMSAVVSDGFLAGIDVSPTMAAYCEKRYRSFVREGKLELKCAQAESLPYPSEYFTKVCSVNSIFYWQDVRRALSEFWWVLVNGGTLVTCFTCKASLENRRFAGYVRLYEVNEVQRMMESCGFQEIRTMRFSDKHREFVCMTGRK